MKLTLLLPDLMSNSLYCLPYNFYDISSENLVLDLPRILYLTFFLILVTCLLVIVWYCEEKFYFGHSWNFKCEMTFYRLIYNLFERFSSTTMSIIFKRIQGQCMILMGEFILKLFENWSGLMIRGGGTQRSAFSGSIRWNSTLFEPLTTA